MPVRRPDRRPQRSFRNGPRQMHTGNRSLGASIDPTALRSSELNSQNEKQEAVKLADSIDEAMGFTRYESGKKRAGWLVNMHSTTILDSKVPGGRAGVDYYFLEEDGNTFKATVAYEPYFMIACKRGKEAEVEEWCRRTFDGLVKGAKRVQKDDLKMPNHLLGYRRTFLQLSFSNVTDLLAVRKVLLPLTEKAKAKQNVMDTYAEEANANAGFAWDDEDERDGFNKTLDPSDHITDIREYDVPYHVRVAIDKNIRVGRWYWVEAKHGVTTLTLNEERITRADPVVMAFDIETTKLPLKFPDATIDQIMMISYMIDGQGFLITNREIVSEDISDFDYTPKAEYDGPFMIFNEPNERALLERFFEHVKEARPTVMVTYNGDFFDWPFVETRAGIQGIDMYHEIGFRKNSEDIYQSDYCAHMDAFAWVNRDSYLPQGSRGLKAVTVAKLGYDPDELDPELMTPYASERPQILAEYSVSDAVATYYLYMKYVHPFIFSLCTIIPLGPDDTLRKGTGTLCEMLLMVQAYEKNIILPNKHVQPREAFWDGHLVESETYVGGHVESIEAGVFRSDIPEKFKIDTTAIDELLEQLDAALKFTITVEEKKDVDDVTNYDEVKDEITAQLNALKESPQRNENPLIYHLDVASMYPNIMTTNRLQPDSMIQEADCAACDFNRPGKTCDRRLPWAWRGEYLPAKRDEYNMIRHALESERFSGRPGSHGLTKSFQELSLDDQASLVKKRLQDYSKKIYHKIHDATTMEREAIICQRENPFYVDTVKTFRDRRYNFKGLQKTWKGKTEALKSSGAAGAEIDEAKKMIVLYDSLQLAHKVILNSFYGYVMRKGSRWYSMEMAGVTCLTGARIIQMARQLVERLGRPLELDTDGIWAILPASFPENFSFKLKNGKKVGISYPCVMLNHLVHARFTNHQYQTLVDSQTFRYETHSDNTIFFEVDGPYKAMILPTSKEEDKNLKKRYAVFNHDGSLAELKGFEVKRRGELKLIKIFQNQLFRFFLEGSTLEETYASVAKIANRWLDVLHDRGATLADEELIDLICENKSMSKTLEEYGAQKSTAITTAKRLAEFLGEQMVKDRGLNCKYIIASKPRNAPVTERAIPVAIFSSEESVKRYYLRKWLREDPGDMDPRTVLDWNYYLERLGSVIQKIITIPAALQGLRNPVPRVAHPDWLARRTKRNDDVFKQTKMTDMFDVSKRPLTDLDPNIIAKKTIELDDLEDHGNRIAKTKAAVVSQLQQKRKSPDADVPAPAAPHDPYASLPAQMPSISDDYEGWLQYQKRKWKIQKQARIRRRQLFGEKRTDATDAIGSFFRNQAEMLYNTSWQIVQLRQTEIPGEVKAFVLIGKRIHALKIMVPRHIYLNLKEDDLPDVSIDNCTVEKLVNYTLPNGHPSVHLFKLSMPEAAYVNEAQKISVLFNHPSVEGVYEKQISLTTRASLELGSVCTFDEQQRGVLGKGLEQGFDLSALHRVSTKQPYLAQAPLTYLYFYHVAVREREVFALFHTQRETATIVVLNRSREEAGFPNVDRIYRDAMEERLSESGGQPWQDSIEYKSSMHFHVVQVTTKRKAHLEIVDAVKKIRKEDPAGATLLAIQSHSRMLTHDMPLLNEFPIISIRHDEGDKRQPPLGWQAFAMKRVVAGYLNLGSWMAHLTSLARYGDIPLGNLDRDDPRYLIDVAYARRLQKERVVLWWSGSSRPDHAGYEQDAILSSLETVEMPSVNNSGTYASVCIDLEVRNLSINTLLSAALINDAEGSDPFSFNPATSSTDGADEENGVVIASENAFAPAGITVLREMVKTWWAEACAGNPMADVMVQHLVRWVASDSSFLYDRALHYYVQMMCKKALQQLMTEFRRVGSQIIFASPTRLLLQTSKAEVGNAYAYSQYILKTVQGKPLFQFLDLEIKEYWDYLVWYDEFNYGGKGCEEVVEAEHQTLQNIMHWQLATYLAPAVRVDFESWLIRFVDLMHSRKQPRLELGDAAPRATQLHFQSLTHDPDDDVQGPPVLAPIFTQQLTKAVTALITRQRKELLHLMLASDWIAPKLPGSHLSAQRLDNAVLQLVKALTHILSLDKTVSLEARLLRKELLALFEVREFSKDGQFVNPSASLCVRDWICDDCACVRDLDLCRDAALLPSAEGTVPTWSCEGCGSVINALAVEERLVADVQRWSLDYCTQDLQCAKCKRLRVNDLMEHCSCAGEWVPTRNRQELTDKLKIYRTVAAAYGMKMLEQLVQGVDERL